MITKISGVFYLNTREGRTRFDVSFICLLNDSNFGKNEIYFDFFYLAIEQSSLFFKELFGLVLKKINGIKKSENFIER